MHWLISLQGKVRMHDLEKEKKKKRRKAEICCLTWEGTVTEGQEGAPLLICRDKVCSYH